MHFLSLQTHARKKDMDNSKLGAKKVKWTEDEEEILVEAVYKLNDTSPAKIERFCGERLTRNQQQIQVRDYSPRLLYILFWIRH